MTDRNVSEADSGDEASDEDYRFDPEDFDGDDDCEHSGSIPDRAPLVIGASVVVGGLLVLAESLLGSRTVTRLPIRPVVPGALILAVGFLYGSAIYVRRGRRRLGYAHAASALGWLLVLLGTVRDSTAVLAVGAGVLLCGAAGLAGLVWAAD